MEITVHVDNAVRVLEADLPPETVKRIEADLTLPNPKWEQVEKYNRSRRRNFQPEMLAFFQRSNGVLILPRGYINHLLGRLGTLPYMVVDRTRTLDPVDFGFRARLHPYQLAAVRDLTARRFGVLEAPPGAGKTVIALDIIARRRQPALVVVHTKELMYQWHRRALEFLNACDDDIGLVGDGRKDIGRKLTIAIINSLYRATASTDVNMASLVGRRGQVTIGIPVGDVGEVLVTAADSTRQLIARTSDGSAIPVGISVRVIETLGSSVLVERIEPAAAPADATSESRSS